MIGGVHCFADSRAFGLRLASELGVPLQQLGVHVFPDQECLLEAEATDDTALLCRSLDHPNVKLVELLLAADALREAGASKVVLVAPYLAYQRQDRSFRSGQSVGQRVIGKLIAENFEGLITLDPHLHRTPSLSASIPRIPSIAANAAGLIADSLRETSNIVIAAPDTEARQWAAPVARELGAPMAVAKKSREGDALVEVEFANGAPFRGRTAVLVDDILSSGATFEAAARAIQRAGGTRIEARVVHNLASPRAIERLRHAGIAQIFSTDSVPGPLAKIDCAPVLAQAARKLDGILT